MIPRSDSSSLKLRLELVSVLLMSLASVASAWCAFQSTLWGGRQMFSLAEAGGTARRASEKKDFAAQSRMVDAGLFVQYMIAVSRGDEKLALFIRKRFRADMRPAFEAWLATEPMTNPEAPATPFDMSQYVLKEEVQAKELEGLADQKYRRAESDNRQADMYVLMTVICALVLFFSGIATKLGDFRSRIAMLTIASLVLVVAAAIFLTYPIALPN